MIFWYAQKGGEESAIFPNPPDPSSGFVSFLETIY